MRRGLLFFAASILALSWLLAGAGEPASAHRSGCHRWHTCPSDTGSYVCGDLGYPCETSSALPTLPPAPTAAPTARPTAPPTAAPVPSVRYFAQTQHWIKGGFGEYWQLHGGLTQQGYPLTEEFSEPNKLDGQSYNVQYFERAVMEYHASNPAGSRILLSQLGAFRLKTKYPSGVATQTPNKAAGAQYFPQTGHWVGGAFWGYWQAHGGLAQQGYPLTDEFQEISDVDGKPYMVQYFERAVFEYHPENVAPYTVLLSPLGAFELNARYPNKSNPASAAAPGAP
jgi:hypothetical protein